MFAEITFVQSLNQRLKARYVTMIMNVMKDYVALKDFVKLPQVLLTVLAMRMKTAKLDWLVLTWLAWISLYQTQVIFAQRINNVQMDLEIEHLSAVTWCAQLSLLLEMVMNALLDSNAMRVSSAEMICVNSSFHQSVNHAAQFSVYQILSAEIWFVRGH